MWQLWQKQGGSCSCEHHQMVSQTMMRWRVLLAAGTPIPGPETMTDNDKRCQKIWIVCTVLPIFFHTSHSGDSSPYATDTSGCSTLLHVARLSCYGLSSAGIGLSAVPFLRDTSHASTAFQHCMLELHLGGMGRWWGTSEDVFCRADPGNPPQMRRGRQNDALPGVFSFCFPLKPRSPSDNVVWNSNLATPAFVLNFTPSLQPGLHSLHRFINWEEFNLNSNPSEQNAVKHFRTSKYFLRSCHLKLNQFSMRNSLFASSYSFSG